MERKPERAGRSLVLIDIENQTGALPELAAPALRALEAAASLAPGDHRVIAAGPAFLKRAAFAIAEELEGRSSRIRQRPGIDGADRLLLDEAEPSWVAVRYDRVVVASGDHCFAPLIAELVALGVEVLVVARQGSISWELCALGAEIITLAPLLQPTA